ncbi:MAG: sulfotransferase [Planctomycetota bacterium]|nr:MAG: sulfotransferase [Planctomycetota bacterium]
MRFAISFVCQQGDLEVKALLLAASLRRYLTAAADLVACLPEPESQWGAVSPQTRRLLASLGVRTVPIRNVIDDAYPIGNKVTCLDAATNAERMVFLDTDILCMEAFDPGRWFAHGFNAKPADAVGFADNPQDWRAVYGMFGLAGPDRRVVTSVAGQVICPYFNAGVIGAPARSGLGALWADCCRTLAAADSLWDNRSLPAKWPFLDQISLPVAVTRAGLEVSLLDERLNFPANLKPLAAGEGGPILCHYHRPDVIRREPRLLELVAGLLDQHPAIADVMATAPAWRQVLARCRSAPSRRHPARGPEGIITGFPRSGTSRLCGLLHGLADHVAINEPRGVAPALNHTHRPWRLPLFYAALRCQIVDGEPIENKVVGGRVIEDTTLVDAYETYVPTVSREDFALWTKNTMSYAMRLPQIRDVMPEAAIVACVRNPFDTIASWISTFPHLRDAAVERFPVGSPADRFLDARQREQIAAIGACDDPPLRRALLWRHLAETLLVNRHHVLLVRYEDLAADPTGTMARILGALPRLSFTSDLGHLRPSPPRVARRVGLTPADVAAIRSTCGDLGRALGYDLDAEPPLPTAIDAA